MFRRNKSSADEGRPSGLPEDMVVIVDQSVNPYLVLFHEPNGYRSEQVRALRNRLVAMNPDGEPKTLVVTSAVRDEGKTIAATPACSSALSWARCPVSGEAPATSGFLSSRPR